MEAVTGGVMLQREKRIQHTQVDPPVPVNPGYVNSCLIDGQQAIRADDELTILP